MNQNYYNDHHNKNSNKLSRYTNSNYSNLQSRLSINQKYYQQNRINKPNIIFESTQITEQVQNEIKLIEQLFINSKSQINQIKTKNKLKQRTIKYQIFNIQQYIQYKDKQIKQINQQIKSLKSQNNNIYNNRLSSYEDISTTNINNNNNSNNNININNNSNNNNNMNLNNNNMYSNNNSYNYNNNSYIKRSVNNNNIRQSYDKQNPSLNFIFKLAQQLKDQKQKMIKLLENHKIKSRLLNQTKQKIVKLQQKYVQKCRQTKERPLRYQDFKQLNQQKKKQIKKKNKIVNNHSNNISSSLNANQIYSNHYTNFNSKINLKNIIYNNSLTPNKNKKNSSISPPRDFIFKNYQNSNIYQNNNTKNQQQNKKTLKQLQNKKHIAEQALKNSKKKHNHELNQLMAKIQFLRDQDQVLYDKIKQKQQEKIYLQMKFSETTKAAYYLNHNRFKNIDKAQPNTNSNRKLTLSSSRKQILSSRQYLLRQNSSLSKETNQYSPNKKYPYNRKLLSPRQKNQPTQQNYYEYYNEKEQF